MARLRILYAVAATLLILFALRAVFLNRIKPAPSVQAVLVLNPSQATSFSTTSTSGAPSKASVQGRKEEELNPSLWNPAEEQIHRRISEELRAAHPKIAAFLMSDALALQFDQVFNNLIQILNESKLAPAARRPAFLLAADRLADQLRFPAVVPPAPEMKHRMDQLAEYGLSFQWSQLGTTWIYSHEMLWEVWRDYSTSPWADDAFIQLLARHWDTSFDCRNGTDGFRPVIQQAEDFLSMHPRSRYRLETLYLLAQANETSWSLSRAKACTTPGESDCDEYADPSKYQQGAEEAQQRAIDYYGKVLLEKSSGDIAVDARRHLDDIRQGIDTVQRRFFASTTDHSLDGVGPN